MQTIRGLVFDKDGTLFDFQRSWAGWAAEFIRTVTSGDPTREASLARNLGFDMEARRFERSSPMIAGTAEILVAAVRRVVPEIGEEDMRDHVLQSSAAAQQVPAVPLAPLLDRLRAAGYALGVATNDGEAPARAHLSAAGVQDRFDFIAGYDSGYGAKPDPGMLEAFCQASDLAPEHCAIIGDSTHDLASGRAAGMVTVGVLTGLAERCDLQHLADVLLPDIGGLPDWLGMKPD